MGDWADLEERWEEQRELTREQFPDEPTNEERAARIPPLVQAHADALGDDELYDEPDKYELASLVTDIHHYCDAHFISFDDMLDAAQNNYEEET